MLQIAQLPNGLSVANVTPHAITFWSPEWSEPVEVSPCGKVINAKAVEAPAGEVGAAALVSTEFVAQVDAEEILAYCESVGALPVGSIIAAQAYPGRVVAMTPAKGYERVAVPLPKPVQDAIRSLVATRKESPLYSGNPLAGQESDALDVLSSALDVPAKRMNPNKFTVFASPLNDGVYAVKNGMFTQVDVFTWGYEGDAPVAQSRVLRDKATGQTALCYGPGVNKPADGYEIVM